MDKIIISPNNNNKPVQHKFPMKEPAKTINPNINCDCGTSYSPCDTTHFQTIAHKKLVEHKAKRAELQMNNQLNDNTIETKQNVFKRKMFNINIET